MGDPVNLRNLAWALTTMLKVILLFYLLRRKLYRSHPAFFIYILTTILMSIVVASAYRHWGFQSIQSWNIFWGGQGVVICTRWLAVAEIARKILANYSGICRLASRLLLAVGICALAYSLLASQNNWQKAVLNADRGLEMSIGMCLVSLFLFARYYRLPIAALEAYLAIGFCLYSCFWIINDSMYERWRASFGTLWNFLEILTFFATLLLWIRAVREHTEAETVTVPAPVSPEAYEKLSLEVNVRLHLLNERLNHLLRTEDSRS
jgi:hypothetical protein